MNLNEIILVDPRDHVIGCGEKVEVHSKGLLHRAFSIFVFNSKGELMLQKRAKEKYHSGGLWTNTCCSHPRFGEDLMQEVHIRLQEEMGFNCELEEKFLFSYEVKIGNLIENEFDHVIFGQFEDNPKPNPEEVEDWKWMSLEDLSEDIANNPQNYTYWFKTAFPRVYETRNKIK